MPEHDAASADRSCGRRRDFDVREFARTAAAATAPSSTSTRIAASRLGADAIRLLRLLRDLERTTMSAPAQPARHRDAQGRAGHRVPRPPGRSRSSGSPTPSTRARGHRRRPERRRSRRAARRARRAPRPIARVDRAQHRRRPEIARARDHRPRRRVDHPGRLPPARRARPTRSCDAVVDVVMRVKDRHLEFLEGGPRRLAESPARAQADPRRLAGAPWPIGAATEPRDETASSSSASSDRPRTSSTDLDEQVDALPGQDGSRPDREGDRSMTPDCRRPPPPGPASCTPTARRRRRPTRPEPRPTSTSFSPERPVSSGRPCSSVCSSTTPTPRISTPRPRQGRRRRGEDAPAAPAAQAGVQGLARARRRSRGRSAAIATRIRVVEGEPGARSRRCPTTSTSSSTARRPCRSTRRSTRPSTPTSAARSASTTTCSQPKGDPHVVHVSTCYVGGMRKGVAPEAALDARRRLARRVRGRQVGPRRASRCASREPDQLRVLHGCRAGQARQGGPAGGRQRRRGGPRRRGSRADSSTSAARAPQTLGWTDVYTLTKAFAERAAEELWGETGHRLSVVRPAIIESALQHPFPGWIDGFKVADPLIMAYGRGLLPEFPGLPDSILDVIPVDFVVNAILAAAANPADAERARVLPRGLGRLEPAAVPRMYENVNQFFVANPMPDKAGNDIAGADLEVPGRPQGRARRAAQGAAGHPAREACSAACPTPTARARWHNQMIKNIADLETLRNFAELYRAYVQTEIIFDDRNTARPARRHPGEAAGRPRLRHRRIDWERLHARTCTSRRSRR